MSPPSAPHGDDLQAIVEKLEATLSKKARGQTPLLSAILLAVAGGTGFQVFRTPETVAVVSQAEFANSKTAVWEKIRDMDDKRTDVKTSVAILATQVSNLTGNVDRLVGAIEKTNEKHEAEDHEIGDRIQELEKKTP